MYNFVSGVQVSIIEWHVDVYDELFLHNWFIDIFISITSGLFRLSIAY